MSRKRTPVTKSMADAVDCLVWRARIHVEQSDALSLKNLRMALEDYEASKGGSGVQGQLELQRGIE